MHEPKRPRTRTLTRRRVLLGAGFAGVAPVASLAWGYDPDWLSVERHRIAVPGLDRPLTAVQVSDLHADRTGSCSELLRTRVAEHIRKVAPDLILATGDYITRPGDDINAAAAWLGTLPAREGTYAVMGNHDSTEVAQALQKRGVHVLNNAWTRVHGLAIVGVGDLGRWAHEPQEVLASVPKPLGKVLLAHQPDSFWTYDEPVSLQISGHTHGGQATLFKMVPAPVLMPRLKGLMMRVPRLEPLAERSYLETRHGAWSGFFRRGDGSTLYVNRGLGRFKRLSLYCPPELTVWELSPA